MYGDGYGSDAEKATELQRRNIVLMGIFLEIANLIKPHVSTRFVEGDPLADAIEQVIRPSGVQLQDTQSGVAIFLESDDLQE